MNVEQLIDQGNDLRAQHLPLEALKCYAQAFVEKPEHPTPWNNYGNVLRECGEPARSVPFLQHAIVLDPNNATAQFNLAVSYLAMGDYTRGWQQYEHRWNYEHLAGTLPRYSQPRWRGEDLKDKTILVTGEQGHGDNIQFSRFLYNLYVMGAKIKFSTTDGLVPLFTPSSVLSEVLRYDQDPGEFDYWVPLMSLPGILGITLENLPRPVNYITADPNKTASWQQTLGPKTRMRVGFSWSGRKDSWLNQHKSMPFASMLELIKQNPQYEWINLQIDVSDSESSDLAELGVKMFPGAIRDFSDSAALIMQCDVVISVDTAVAHLSGSLGRPTWLLLNWFAACWRWGVKREDCPWYSVMRVFRQPQQDDWNSVITKVGKFLSWFKV